MANGLTANQSIYQTVHKAILASEFHHPNHPNLVALVRDILAGHGLGPAWDARVPIAGGQSGLWACKFALRKSHMRRSVGGCGAGTGRVRWALWTANAGVKTLANSFLLG